MQYTDKHIKVLLVGDLGCGKRSLKMRYVYNKFDINSLFQAVMHFVKQPNKNLNYYLNLHDNSELEHLKGLHTVVSLRNTRVPTKRLSILSFKNSLGTDVVVLCFSITNRSSFQNIEAKWHSAVTEKLQNVPIILAGTKYDLRKSFPEHITTKEGLDLKKKLHLIDYIECSSSEDENVHELFKLCLDRYLEKEKYTKKTEKKSPLKSIFKLK